MNTKALIFFLIGLAALIVATYFTFQLFKEPKFLIPVGATLLAAVSIWLGLSTYKKKEK